MESSPLPVRRGRVLSVATTFPRWEGDATPAFVLHLAQDLQSLGWQVDVLAPHAPGSARQERLSGVLVNRFRYLWPESAETVCYQGGAVPNLLSRRWEALKLPPLVMAEWAAILRRLARGRYDLLHSHWLLPQGLLGVLTARPLGVPHVVTVHGGDVFRLRAPWLAALKRVTLRRAGAVTVNSTATWEAVRELAPELGQVHQIPMGVAVPPSGALTADADRVRKRHRRGEGPLLLFVGRLVDEKGAQDLIRAVTGLATRLPDVTAMVVGEGPERGRLEREARDQGIADRVSFVGWRQPAELPAYYAAADVFIGPSRRSADGWVEAQGLTFLEAMAAGSPVVATRVGGIVDHVRDGVTGLLVEERSPEQIAEAVHRVVTDRGLARRLSEAGRRLVVDRFSRETSARRFSDLFSSLVQGRGPAEGRPSPGSQPGGS
jgi:glycosyltransferase involved in cell wall biosynthesis